MKNENKKIKFIKKIKRAITLCMTMTILIGGVLATEAFAATPYVRSDTPAKIEIPQCNAYTFKMTIIGTSATPVFTTGNSNVVEIYTVKNSGNVYYVSVVPTGRAGTAVGIYSSVLGQKEHLQCVVTVRDDSKAVGGEKYLGMEEGSWDTSYGTCGEPETQVYKSGKLIHDYLHTCVGDLDIVNISEGQHQGAVMEFVAAAFKKAHPNWTGSYYDGNVSYDLAPYDGHSTYDDVVDFCNGDANNIANMTQEQLYTLSAMYNDGAAWSNKFRFCNDRFVAAWSKMMSWDSNEYAGWNHTVNGEEYENTEQSGEF